MVLEKRIKCEAREEKETGDREIDVGLVGE
jgi:hypothetical protein